MLKISVMTGKLTGIRALNTNPLTNSFCIGMAKMKDTICAECYSARMLRTFRQSCVPNFDHNARELNGWISAEDLPRFNDKVFRISGHGEMETMCQFDNVMRFINANPFTHFGWWTKRAAMAHEWMSRYPKPKNLTLIFSNPWVDTDMPVPKGFDKVFNVRRDKKRGINCKGKCVDCMLCYTHNKTKQIREVIK